MGFIIKFFLIFTFVYLLLKAIVALLMGRRGKPSNNFQRQRAQNTKQPENQQERIIEYQKKNFESSDVEDVEFVEIKEKMK